MSDRAEIFFEDFVVGLGFFSGLWYAIKLNPLAEMFKALTEMIKILNPESKLGLLLLLIPTLILVLSILAAYSMGGEWGLIAVICGFLAGGLIFVTDGFSIFLLFVGMVLGAFAVSSKRDNILF